MREILICCLFAALTGIAVAQDAAGPARDAGTTVWDGAYSDAQADRGAEAYTAACARCHGDDLRGVGGVLIGDQFMRGWQTDTVDSLFMRIRSTMPARAAGSLEDNTYLDIIAFVLKANSFPSGTKELTLDALPTIRITGEGGADAAPDYALVEVVGCLSQRADKAWMVTRASEPVRTRNPDSPEGADQQKAAAKPLGNHTFRLDEASVYRPQNHNGHKVDAKGFLLRSPGGDSLNTTSISTLAESCDAGPAAK
jgi:mono/diheme cytochrome c family protein